MPLPLMAAEGAFRGGRAIYRHFHGAKHPAARAMAHRKRRRKGLTQKMRNDLLWLKQNVGKTAAANYLSRHNLA